MTGLAVLGGFVLDTLFGDPACLILNKVLSS